jgi:hypothetical protein
MFRVTVPVTANTTQGIILGSYFIQSGSRPTAKLFSIFNSNAGTSNGPFTITINGTGWDGWADNFAQMGSGGTSNTGNILKFFGTFNGNTGGFQAQAPIAGDSPGWQYIVPATTSGITVSGTTTF